VNIPISRQHINQFQKRVLTFYADHKRTLPWRQTTDPYKILVSEVMLQQTQVSRVIPYYEAWIKTWPTIDSLAQADKQDVLKAWMGLGYNRRAINLHRAALVIQDRFQADVPLAMQHFDEIPGVGEYTAQAVLIFSTNADIVTVDTNIRRILIAEFKLPETISNHDLWDIARQCLPRGRSRDWHNALMDYGALLITARQTGIAPKTRQSRYEGSDRQIRARLLKILLEMPATLPSLSVHLEAPEERLLPILSKMCHEGLLAVDDSKYKVA
jgi:A/G-specific adenine glycosylase